MIRHDAVERFDPAQLGGRLIDAEHRARYSWVSTLARGRRVLDAGCGVGYGTLILAAAGAVDAVGVDVSVEAVEMARRRDGNPAARFDHGDIRELRFPDDSFDLVVCFDAIEHVATPRAVLRELRRVLVPGGVLALSTPNRRRYPPGDQHHVHEFTPEELEQDVRSEFPIVSVHRQDVWLTSLVCDDDLQGMAGESSARQVSVDKVAANEPGSELYTVVLAGDSELPELPPTAILADCLDLGEWQKRVDALERELADARLSLEQAQEQLGVIWSVTEAREDATRRLDHAQAAYGALRESFDELQARHATAVADLEQQVVALTSSTSWRATRPLRAVRNAVRRVRRRGGTDADSGRSGASDDRDPAPPAAPAGDALRLTCEFPPDGATVTNYLWVAGWAVGEVPLTEVVVHVAGAAHPARIGTGRWDVTAQFGAQELAALPGYELLLPMAGVEPGDQQIEIVARDQAGREAHIVRSIEIGNNAVADNGKAAPALNGSAPRLGVFISPGTDVADEARSRTLASLSAQTYGASRIEAPVHSATPDLDDLAEHGIEWVVFGRAGDSFAPDALARIAAAIRAKPDADVVYADDERPSASHPAGEPFFKPGWSPELALGMDYVGPFCAIRRRLLVGIPASSAEVALLHLLDSELRVVRIPHVLYRLDRPPSSGRPSLGAISKLASDRGMKVEVREEAGGIRHLDWKPAQRPLVSIIVPSVNSHGLLERCVKSIRVLTRWENYELLIVDNTPDGMPGLGLILDGIQHRVISWPRSFNYSVVNNVATERARGEYLVLLNDDTEVLSPDWLERLFEQACQPGVGVVGAKLVRPDGTLQHAGVRLVQRFVAAKTTLDGVPADDAGPHGILRVPRNCAAVTFACVMVPRAIYRELGGLDPAFQVACGDVDFCLRALGAGYRVVYTPYAELLHHEQASRGRVSFPADARSFADRWRGFYDGGDPYYHPSLSDIVDYETDSAAPDFPVGVQG